MRRKIQALPFVLLLLPLDVVVAAGLLLSQAIGFIARGRRTDHPGAARHPSFSRRGISPPETGGVPAPAKRKPDRAQPQEKAQAGWSISTTIVIVNWDGKHLLEEALPALLEAIAFDGGSHEVTVVDNGSIDGSVEFVREKFPKVRVLALDRNYGFSGGNNRGIRELGTDIVVLLNNDMIVDKGFLGPLVAGFSDPSVFAVTSQIFFADAARRREETGKTRGRFERGFFYLWHDELTPEDERREAIPVFWAGGGSCAMDRARFIELGGFDSLYRPFYLEDTDMSYQAWKREWKCVLAPASRVVHKHRGTSRPKFGEDFVENTIRKNQFVFVWKNVTDFPMVLRHIVNLPRIHGRAILRNGAAFEIRAYLRAFRQLPEALWKRLANMPHYIISDREVLTRSQKP